jgi:solute carrier family 35 (adenosine 3'-phospho 5'-phosphosulfate transporter), member B3
MTLPVKTTTTPTTSPTSAISPTSSSSSRFRAYFRLGNSWFDRSLSSDGQFAVLVGGVFFFFGLHNYLQEAILHVKIDENVDDLMGQQQSQPRHSVMLGYFEVLGVAVCSYIERALVRNEHERLAPPSAYPLLTLLLLSSSALSNMSLSYINFPTKVVFRSCKLIPTMAVAGCLHNRKFTLLEYICALAACLGLCCFAAADSYGITWGTTSTTDSASTSTSTAILDRSLGLFLVSASVVADAILPNAQEKVFRTYKSSRLEVTLYTNIYTLAVMTLTTYLSGDLVGAVSQMMTNRILLYHYLIYTFIAYIAISFHMAVVKRYGGVAAVLVATGRKAMTLIVSFVLFPKRFTILYPIGAILVLGGLAVASLAKIHSKGGKQHDGGHKGHHNGNGNGTTLLPRSTEMQHLIDDDNSNNSNMDDHMKRHVGRRTSSEATRSPTTTAHS